MDGHDRIKSRIKGNEIKKKYGIDHKTYRKAYARWKLAIKRGLDVTLEFCLENRYKRIKSRPKGNFHYSSHKQFLKRALATPKWVDIEAICEIYRNKPVGYHVDHIVPINGENVCGLHVPWNLQYLSIRANRKKSNKVV